ncbi:probable clathrin assembly protein At4g32285 [Salvia hispanica]|uniref:probable clathrin assembly protein At4g32285 n=1 Tax=Salvia hispanica TaxID=49212 RepID=UPI0020098520|nr:probable clathrin assembly protein At4g32285 [Salvia hispanica]
MASSTLRKAIGVVKDHTSISLAKVTGNVAPDLEVLVVKATTHENEAADDKYAKEILILMASSRINVNACVFAVSKRLTRTSDWIVALKVLVLVHKLLIEGGPVFRQEMLFASRRGPRVLNMAGFRDDAHSSSWDQSSFVRAYARYLDQKLETMACGRKNLSVGDGGGAGYGRDEDGFRRAKSCDDFSGGGSRMGRDEVLWLKDLSPERVLDRLNQLLRVLGRFLASRPTGAARSARMVLVALRLLVRDSFVLYDDICDVLKHLLECFSDMEYAYPVTAFDAYVNAAKMIVDLNGFYDWVKDVGIVRPYEFPQVEKISDQLLGLERLMREKANRAESLKEEESFSQVKDEGEEVSVSDIKALPPPENPLQDLVNLDDDVSVDQESNKLALSLFSEWVEFPENGEGKVSSGSAWENPAAERGKADWEVVLVESVSNLSMQQVAMGGGLDALLLNGMYDQGEVKQHFEASRMIGGSASSVALPGQMSGGATEVLALPPAPDVAQKDPFAASLSVPPPAYVQMADLEMKRELLAQEQQLWQRQASNGMQGQLMYGCYGGGGGGAMPQHVGLKQQQQGAYY